MPKTFIVITTSPEYFPGILETSVTGRALNSSLWHLKTVNIYDFGHGNHRKIDDTPYGGGAGLILRPDVMYEAIMAGKRFDIGLGQRTIFLSPRGQKFSQKIASELALDSRDICLICGKFEGIDQRVIDLLGIEELSIGDFVLSCGEVAAYCVINSVVRLLDKVIEPDSLKSESFSKTNGRLGILEYHHYTKPRIWQGMSVPEELISGNHANIKCWKDKNSLKITSERRPDLLQDLENDIK